MKKITLTLALVAALVGCKRTVHDSGCISRYEGPQFNYPPLTANQLDTIKSLFSANGLSMANLNFTYYYSNTLKDSTNTPYFNQQIGASLIVNGLPVLYPTANWNFHNGTLYLPFTSNPQYPNPGSDTAAHQTLPALRSLFFKTYEAALYTSTGNNRNLGSARLGRPGSYYHDSCLFAQLGYIDASWQPNSGGTYGKKLLKVWLVYPAHTIFITMLYRAPTPTVFVIDETGEAWCQYPTYPGDPVIYN